MLFNPSLAHFIPQFSNTVGGASIVFAPLMNVFGFALLFILSAWMISQSQMSSKRLGFFSPYIPYQPLHNRSHVHYHPSQTNGNNTNIHNHHQPSNFHCHSG